MEEQFLSLELAKKLKEKGFSCKYPFAMYNELGTFLALFTSADKYKCESGYQYREYFNFDDFDEYDFIAPTIEQVLNWLREEKKIHVEIVACAYGYNYIVSKTPPYGTELHCSQAKWEGPNNAGAWYDYEPAAIAAIEYVLDNLI